MGQLKISKKKGLKKVGTHHDWQSRKHWDTEQKVDSKTLLKIDRKSFYIATQIGIKITDRSYLVPDRCTINSYIQKIYVYILN